MAGFSNYLESRILNWIKGTTFGTAPTAVYVGLFSNDPTDAGSGTEVTATIRTAGRVAVTFGTVGDGTMTNNAAVDFGAAAGAATVSHFAIFDAASAGNMLASGPLAASQSISTGTEVTFASGALTVTID